MVYCYKKGLLIDCVQLVSTVLAKENQNSLYALTYICIPYNHLMNNCAALSEQNEKYITIQLYYMYPYINM